MRCGGVTIPDGALDSHVQTTDSTATLIDGEF